jgi:hypothetical protein
LELGGEDDPPEETESRRQGEGSKGRLSNSAILHTFGGAEGGIVVAATDALDPDELAALNSIVEFIQTCLNDPEVVAAIGMAEAAWAGQEFAARRVDSGAANFPEP